MRPSMSLELKARVTRSIRDLEKKVEDDEGSGEGYGGGDDDDDDDDNDNA